MKFTLQCREVRTIIINADIRGYPLPEIPLRQGGVEGERIIIVMTEPVDTKVPVLPTDF